MFRNLIVISFLILFTACSSKQYYEPRSENIEEINFHKKDTTSGELINMNRVGGTFVNGNVVTKKGIKNLNTKDKNFKFINTYKEKIIASNYKDKLLIDNEIIETTKPVIAASIKGNYLALIYSNNTIELKDLNSKKTLFKEYLSLSLANDTRVVNPLFMDKILIFPSLDGKLQILSLETHKLVRSIILDANGEFNNPILLDISKDTLVASSANKVLTIHEQALNSKNYEIRDVLLKDNFIYLATIDGQIIKLDLQLNEIKKVKYQYGKFYTLASKNNYIYALESQGYLMKLTDDLEQTNLYEFQFDNDNRVLSLGDKIYFDTDYINLP
jgi:WD40 repeat protein